MAKLVGSDRVGKLRNAAQGILDVALDMNTKSKRCDHCGVTGYENFAEAKLYTQLSSMAEKLRRAANELEKEAGVNDAQEQPASLND